MWSKRACIAACPWLEYFKDPKCAVCMPRSACLGCPCSRVQSSPLHRAPFYAFRWTGGDGAPAWTLEAAGFDVTKLDATGAALTHQGHGDPLPPMIWGTNNWRLATATMFTVFFAGNTFAPGVTAFNKPLAEGGALLQDFLQDHYTKAMAQVAAALKVRRTTEPTQASRFSVALPLAVPRRLQPAATAATRVRGTVDRRSLLSRGRGQRRACVPGALMSATERGKRGGVRHAQRAERRVHRAQRPRQPQRRPRLSLGA